MTQVGKVDDGPETTHATSRGTRWALLAAGHVCVALGVIGAFLPLLPTTVFLILAAACYARGSTRLYHWIVNHRVFGPVVRDWRAHRAMSVKAKVAAITVIVLTFGATIAFAFTRLWVRLTYAAFAVVLIAILLRIRTKR